MKSLAYIYAPLFLVPFFADWQQSGPATATQRSSEFFPGATRQFARDKSTS